ncbi:uncharacterized protein FTOL_13878 [Fusarium torulosum]|uniref:Uncharacterized protein n=1 Tax=Fusarium torulosum TaxID=33205 RepID=A0AAE8SQ96_9HYPO|nr:uncharacterized protein FTOL_13878 [Fusarium torulosum]
MSSNELLSSDSIVAT